MINLFSRSYELAAAFPYAPPVLSLPALSEACPEPVEGSKDAPSFNP